MSQPLYVVSAPEKSPAGASASTSDSSFRPPALSDSTQPAPANAPRSKLRSCVVCRSRKVRCDRLSPCSNCRRADIACVFPSADRPPRWARRLERITNEAASSTRPLKEPDPAATQVIERLRTLESLVKELSSQLEQANAVASGSSSMNSPESLNHDRDTDHQRQTTPNSNADDVQKHFGRLVVKDANRSRYVSSGFWSRVNDELDALKIDSRGLRASDTDTSEDEASPRGPTKELERAPSERHAFLFRHNISPSTSDVADLHPLPSQVPFLLDVFCENVNSVMRIVHMPTVARMTRGSRSDSQSSLTSANEALMFSMYYAAVTSMEEEDIVTNFGSTKSDLNLKFRLGLEHALAKADFLNVPDLVCLQAFSIFLGLVRRHDSPRFVWMMTGLAIRIGQALGLHRDGTHFKEFTPFEIEMRRRAWWALVMLDVRASEDQGMDYTIARGSFDTKLPLNVNDVDMEPATRQLPTEREGITDMTLPLLYFEMNEIVKQLTEQNSKARALTMEEKSCLLHEIYETLEQRYLRHSTASSSILYWVSVTITRLVMAKMTLFVYLPILFSSPSEHLSGKIKDKLLVAAIEVAEYNHALNAEHASRSWRWVYQTYTHWYAVVYLLIEISRRSWSPICERAWVALHSQWLIPSQSQSDKNLRVWLPLRKLTTAARRHRESELERLRNDPQTVAQLETDYQRIPIPGSPGPFSAGSDAVELFRCQWRQLCGVQSGPDLDPQIWKQSKTDATSSNALSAPTILSNIGSAPADNASVQEPKPLFDAIHPRPDEAEISQNSSKSFSNGLALADDMQDFGETKLEQIIETSYSATLATPITWSIGPGFVPQLLAETDPSVDLFANMGVDPNVDGEMDWYNWIESAKGMEWDVWPSGNN